MHSKTILAFIVIFVAAFAITAHINTLKATKEETGIKVVQAGGGIATIENELMEYL